MKAPVSSRQTARSAAAMLPAHLAGALPPAGERRPRCRSRCAAGGPRRSRSSRSCAKFSMIPLWTTATWPVQSTCGWALASVGPPWVAQRVWPMPLVPVQGRSSSASAFSSLASLPALRSTRSLPSSTMATPGGVVSAVLQPAQAVHGDLEGILMPDVSHDAAHVPQPKPRTGRPSARRDPGRGAIEPRRRRRSARRRPAPARLCGGLDHDPDQRLRTRRAQQHAPGIPELGRDALHLGQHGSSGGDRAVGTDVDQHLRQPGHDARELGERCPGDRQPLEQQQRRQQAVAGGRVLGVDDVPALLAAQGVAAGAHRLEDVAVADGGLEHRDARRRAWRGESPGCSSRSTTTVSSASAPRSRRARARDARGSDRRRPPGRRHRPPGTGRRRRRAQCRRRPRRATTACLQRGGRGGAAAVVDAQPVAARRRS